MTGWDPARVAARTPVLVGIGLISQRADSARAAREALELMVDAAVAAGLDSGVPRLLARVRQVYVPHGRWGYRNPGRAIAERIGASSTRSTRSLLARVGVLQERLIADAAIRIAEGDLDAALVVGGDAGYRRVQMLKAGMAPIESQQCSEPDVLWQASESIVTDEERATGLAVAAPGYYAIIESASRARSGVSVSARAAEVAERYSAMSRVAAVNPHAWTPTAVEPGALAASAANPMVAFPYTRLHCSDWSVDQASALLLCSAEVARDESVPVDRWVFPQAGAYSDQMVPLSARDRLDEAEGIRLAVDAALGATGIEPDSLDVVDLYSCYPAALRAHSDAVGVRDGLPLTVTGGMRFGGGPFNNYVLHATGQAALRLRSGQARYGAISSVSGMLTKHAFGVWGATPNPAGYQVHDVTDQVARHCRPRALRRDFSGKATIAGYTVLYEHNVPATAVAVLEPTDGSRVIARSADATAVGELSGTVEQCGRTVRVDGDQFTMQESAHGT